MCKLKIVSTPNHESEHNNWYMLGTHYHAKLYNPTDILEMPEDSIYMLEKFGFKPTWDILDKWFDIDVEEFKDEVKYRCPWSKNEYYYFMPLFYKPANPTAFRKMVSRRNDKNRWLYLFEEASDKWGWGWWIKPNEVKVTSLTDSLMGHGYTQAIAYDNGSPAKQYVVVNCEDGSQIYGVSWRFDHK